MTAEDIRALRKELNCTAKELGVALGLEQSVVFAWEKDELFPTKQYVVQMEALREKGPSGVPRQPKLKRRGAQVAHAPSPGDAYTTMTDPVTWALVRKLLAYPELRAEVAKIAMDYADPATTAQSSP